MKVRVCSLPRALPVVFPLALVLAMVGAWTGCSGSTRSVAPPPPPTPGLSSIQHIVFIIKENRSFDQYFGTFPGADGAVSGKTSTGATIPLGQTPDKMAHDLGHGWWDAHTAIDGGSMDKFDKVSGDRT